MHICQSRPVPPSARRALVALLFLTATTVSAQTVSSQPAWATPVNDVTGRQVMATPVTPGTPALSRVRRDVPIEAPLTVTSASRPAVATYALRARDGALASTRATVPAGPNAYQFIIPTGTLLSRGLSDYVKRFGWTLRWLIPQDYRLDAPFPIPAGPMAHGVTYVVRAYQSQGGLLGDVPRFAGPNRVVVIQPVIAQETR